MFATSRDVAEYFEKRHDNVLRDIDALVAEGVLNFEETPYVNAQNGQTYRCFEMDRDGFTLLAMGFTGPKAVTNAGLLELLDTQSSVSHEWASLSISPHRSDHLRLQLLHHPRRHHPR